VGHLAPLREALQAACVFHDGLWFAAEDACAPDPLDVAAAREDIPRFGAALGECLAHAVTELDLVVTALREVARDAS
jgi:hypothetical protein